MEKRWLALGLGAVIALQIYTLNRIGDPNLLRRQVGNLETQVSVLSGRINNLENQMQTLALASEWVQGISFQVDDSAGCGQVNVMAQWSLRDVEPGARVEFLYRNRTEQQWHTIAAESTGAGGYRASFPVTGTITGSPSISVEGPAGRGNSSTMTTEAGPEPELQYEYRIAATSGEQSRSSAPESFDVSKAFYAWYQIAAMVQPDGYRVRVTRNLKPDALPCTSVTEARARGMVGDRVVLERSLQVDAAGSPEVMWAELATKEKLDRIEVTVKFGAGTEQTHSVRLK